MAASRPTSLVPELIDGSKLLGGNVSEPRWILTVCAPATLLLLVRMLSYLLMMIVVAIAALPVTSARCAAAIVSQDISTFNESEAVLARCIHPVHFCTCCSSQ